MNDFKTKYTLAGDVEYTVDELKDKITDMMREYETLETDFNTANIKLARCTAEIATGNSTRDKLRTENTRVSNELKKALESVTPLNEANTKYMDENKVLIEEKRILNEKYEQLFAKEKQLNSTHSSLLDDYQKLLKAKHDVEKLHNQITLEHQETLQKLENANKHNEGLTQRLQTIDKEHNKRIESLEDELKESVKKDVHDTAINTLKDRIIDLENNAKNGVPIGNVPKSELEAIKQQLVEAKQELDDTKNQLLKTNMSALESARTAAEYKKDLESMKTARMTQNDQSASVTLDANVDPITAVGRKALADTNRILIDIRNQLMNQSMRQVISSPGMSNMFDESAELFPFLDNITITNIQKDATLDKRIQEKFDEQLALDMELEEKKQYEIDMKLSEQDDMRKLEQTGKKEVKQTGKQTEKKEVKQTGKQMKKEVKQTEKNVRQLEQTFVSNDKMEKDDIAKAAAGKGAKIKVQRLQRECNIAGLKQMAADLGVELNVTMTQGKISNAIMEGIDMVRKQHNLSYAD
jgi:hypothetical protein